MLPGQRDSGCDARVGSRGSAAARTAGSELEHRTVQPASDGEVRRKGVQERERERESKRESERERERDVCVCIYIHMYIYIYMYMYTTHIYISIRIHMYVNVCICVYILCMHISRPCSWQSGDPAAAPPLASLQRLTPSV